MIKQNKTKLQFILGGFFLATLAISACNNEGDTKEAAEEPVKTEEPAPVAKDSTDTMEVTPGSVSPTPEAN